MVGEGSPTEAIALQVDGPRDADHGGARRSKEGRRSLCSQDANDRFWHSFPVEGSRDPVRVRCYIPRTLVSDRPKAIVVLFGKLRDILP